MPSPLITVVGIGADGWPGLSEPGRQAVSAAAIVVGGPRQLDLLPAEITPERVPLPSPLHPGLSDLLTRWAGRTVAVLASGDPMFYGIGATVVRLLGPDRVTVLPHPSSVSLAAARLGWPLAEVDVVSAVGRPLALVQPSLQPGRRLLVLVSEPTSAAEVRALLQDRGYGSSPVTVLADLGSARESIRPADDEPHSRLAIVAVECIPDPDAPLLPRTPGLPDDAFAQDGQITKYEIRAIALAALLPGPGQLLWDVGAGSGSIGIEWMRCHPANHAIAVEPRADRQALITTNSVRLGVPGLQLVAGTAPAALAGLPRPDAIFIGGGVTAPGLLETCWSALTPGGRLVANAVTIESEQTVATWHHRLGGSLTRIALERAGGLGRFTAWRPALPVVQWAIRKSDRPEAR